MLKVRFIGRGMRLEFHHPGYATRLSRHGFKRFASRFAPQQTAHWAGDGRRLKKGRFTVRSLVTSLLQLTSTTTSRPHRPAASPLAKAGATEPLRLRLMGGASCVELLLPALASLRSSCRLLLLSFELPSK